MATAGYSGEILESAVSPEPLNTGNCQKETKGGSSLAPEARHLGSAGTLGLTVLLFWAWLPS